MKFLPQSSMLIFRNLSGLRSAQFSTHAAPLARIFRLMTLLGLCGAALSLAHADDPFADVIRKTPPLTPEQEQKSFHLPPGFEIQLVASEPQIGKPMNLAFDSRGRLWITQSREYPFPVLPVTRKGRDKIQILENFDANGHARKIHVFQDGLNIPIGLYPYQNGVIAFSIPKIHFFQDTDGDGRADRDEVLVSGFGYQKDTHGLTSNFRRGYDGWIYADHGFNNDSTLVGRDGSTITMNSGNSYRFRPDGTHVEHFSFGQVNPFGLMFDPLGDLWSADCHSSPTYVLLHGAYYPSFGKPNDGLGFAPEICRHSHGSTAIAGMIYYCDDQFPSEFRGNTLIGNVMTCRINRDSYIEHGSTRIAKEEPDFLSSDDPWFRPVNLAFGPDGAIYVADFYNRIIGHYEVPLDNPGRDRERGRIWRIIYTGHGTNPPSASSFNISKAPVSRLLSELASPNITRRMLATDEIVDRIGAPAIKPLAKLVRSRRAADTQKVHGLWALERLGGITEPMLKAAAADPARVVRVHAMRILAELSHWTPAEAKLARKGSTDPDAYVQRSAADALGQHPMTENVRALLNLRENTSTNDEELVYVTRMALRNQLLSGETMKAVQTGLSRADEQAIADVAVAVKTETAAGFLLNYVDHASVSRDKLQPLLEHIARYAPEAQVNQLRDFTRQHFARDLDFQLRLYKSIQAGIGQRGGALPSGLRDWGVELAGRLINSARPENLEWRSFPLANHPSADPWFLQKRSSADGDTKSTFMCSLPPGGESLTGILRSRPFTLPPQLRFFVAGHDGPPDKPRMNKNFIRLIEAGTGKELATALPPRNDTAQPVVWDLKQFAGKTGYIEVTDANTGTGYAWLALGRFDPPVTRVPKIMPSQYDHRWQSAAELAAELRVTNIEPSLNTLFQNQSASEGTRAAAAKALMTLNAAAHARELGLVLTSPAEPEALREACASTLAESGSPSAPEILSGALAAAPQNLQMHIALAMASRPEGAEALLTAVEKGKASRHLLQDKTIRDRLMAAKPANLSERLETLTRGLPPEDAERQRLIDQRVAAFNQAKPSAELGTAVFKQNCAICHSLDGQGATIGPQLDGVGNRGAARIIEDVLDPSRNVDPAFRVTLLMLKDGDVESGLVRREEGEMLVIAEGNGKERSIPKADITGKRSSQLSLMPDNFSQIIPTNDFYNLIAYLSSKSTKGSASR